MGPVRQNPIQRTVRSVHMCVQFTMSLIIFPLTLQTIIIAPMMPTWGKGGQGGNNSELGMGLKECCKLTHLSLGHCYEPNVFDNHTHVDILTSGRTYLNVALKIVHHLCNVALLAENEAHCSRSHGVTYNSKNHFYSHYTGQPVLAHTSS